MPILVRLKLDRLRDLMARSNLSQNHWALRIGISRGHWSEIVNGKHPYPSPKTRDRMLEVFGVPYDELFANEPAPAGWSDPSFQAAIGDRYLVDEEVGQGGMGTVYLARDVKLGRRVALKVLAPEAVSGVGAEQFLKEIRYTARLQHPNVLGLHDAGSAAGFPFYVMPYVKGGSLRELLSREGRLPLERTVRIAQGIGAALQHAHDEHLLHCDVKPENVLLDGDHVYVADFGVARAIHAEVLEWGRQNALDSSAGTPAYVSPEHASGEKTLDARADVYSLACVIFEMLAGRPPFIGENSTEIVAQRFMTEVPDVRAYAPEVPAAVAATVERGMLLVPGRRTTSVSDFVRELTAAAQPRSAPLRAVDAIRHAIRSGLRAVGVRREASRTRARSRFMEGMMQDVRQAVRSLRRVPGFAAVAMLTLALGIGANTAIFTLVNGVLIRPLPYERPDELVMVWEFDTRAATLAADMRAMDDDGKWTVSPANYTRWRDRTQSFADLAAFNIWWPTMSGEGPPEEVNGSIVTPNYFELMGVTPLVGSGFVPEHGIPGNNGWVMISESFWRRRFGADSAVVGRTVRLNGESYAVIGVVPSTYRHPDPSVFDPVDVWAPIAFDEPHTSFGRYLRVVGRLAPGMTPEAAGREMRAVALALAEETPDANRGWDAYVITIREELFGEAREAMLLLLGAAGFVFLIASTNVANLVLARSHGRRKEFAVRTALGAGRGRLVRQLVVENVLVSVAGGVLGVLAVRAGLGLMQGVQGQYMSAVADVRVDTAVILFMLALALVAGTVLGILPVLQSSRGDLRTPLMEESAGAGVSRGAQRLRSALVVSQVALAAVLVVGSGLLMRSFTALLAVEPGFDTERVLSTRIVLPRDAYEDDDRRREFVDRLMPALVALPGVEQAALVSDLPFTTENRFTWVNPLDDLRPEGEELLIEYRTVGPGYFRVMDIPLRAGRDFGPLEGPEGDQVVIVNEAFGQRVWPGQDPMGKQFIASQHQTVTVVGVVANILDDGYDGEAEPRLYRSYHQTPGRGTAVVLEVRGDMASVPAGVQREVEAIDPEVLVGEFVTMKQLASATVADDRMALSLAGVISLLALALAAVGIYGVTAYAVGERRRELGIRAALGAQRGTVMRLVLRRALVLAAAGTLGGVAAALVLVRLLQSLLFGVSPADPVTLLATPLLLAAIALVASYVPAARASLVSPIEALRSER